MTLGKKYYAEIEVNKSMSIDTYNLTPYIQRHRIYHLKIIIIAKGEIIE